MQCWHFDVMHLLVPILQIGLFDEDRRRLSIWCFSIRCCHHVLMHVDPWLLKHLLKPHCGLTSRYELSTHVFNVDLLTDLNRFDGHS